MSLIYYMKQEKFCADGGQVLQFILKKSENSDKISVNLDNRKAYTRRILHGKICNGIGCRDYQ